MQGNCRLFGTHEDLKESHIYPAFAIEYLKKTGSKYIRTFTKPNVRQQDGIKLHLLSEKAEQKFSLSEKWFSENIFIPYLDNGIREFNYNENLFYFSISFLWRIIVLNLDSLSNKKDEWYSEKLKLAENEWRSFLADYKYPENFNNIQLFFTDRIKDTNSEAKGLDYYTSRAFDGTIITNESQKYIAVYGKFLRFIFWCVIKTDKNYSSKDLLINPIKGKLLVPQTFDDDYLSGFLINRSNQIANLTKPSPTQQQKIVDEILKDKDAFWNSDAGKAIYNDKFNLDNKTNSP